MIRGKNNMNMLSTDFGVHCGWATLQDGKILTGVQDFTLKRGESSGIRWLRFRKWIDEMWALTPFGIWVYEQPIYQFRSTSKMLAVFVAEAEAFAAEKQIEIVSVHPGTLKRFATGYGKASKRRMMDEAMDRFGLLFGDEHEADAFWLLRWGMAEFCRKEM